MKDVILSTLLSSVQRMLLFTSFFFIVKDLKSSTQAFKLSQHWPLQTRLVESNKKCSYSSPDQIIVDNCWMKKHPIASFDVQNSQNICPDAKTYNNKAI